MKWVQDRVTGKLIPEREWLAAQHVDIGYAGVLSDIGDFENPQGVWLHGRKQLREDLVRQNCHVYERGERDYIEKMRDQHERDQERSLHRRVAEIAAEKGLGRPD